MVLSEVDEAHLRYGLRVYFIVGMFVLAIIGSQCCKLATKYDLIRGKPVPLHRMTGWLYPKELFFVIWKLKRFPGGWWLGLMMIVAAIITIAADFATNSIKAIPIRSRCKFDTGLVTSLELNRIVFSSPPSNGYPATLAANAQSISNQLGCDIGIYKKIPGSPDLLFCAGEDDIIGTWVCDDLNKDRNFNSSVTLDEIEIALANDDIQSFNISNSGEWSNDYSHSTHLTLWSFYEGDNETTPGSEIWPIHSRISVDLGFDLDAPKTMKSFECNLTASNPDDWNGLEAIAYYMYWDPDFFDSWINGFQGMIYNGTGSLANSNIKELSGNLSQYLNTMSMVQGGSNSVVNTTLPNDVPLYGCITMRTDINSGVIFLACFTGLILLVTFTYYITLLALLGKHGLPSCCSRNKHVDGEINLSSVPSSTLSWMLHASRERAIGDEAAGLMSVPAGEEALRDWHFSLVDSGSGQMRLVRVDVSRDSGGSSVEQVPLSVPPNKAETESSPSYA